MAHWLPELTVATLRPLAERAARRILRERLDEPTVETVVDRAWTSYRALEPEIPDEATVGAGVMVHLSAWIVGIYHALASHGLSKAEARQWTARVAWPIYEKVAQPAWTLARLGANTPVERARRTMNLFFRFPYASPGY